MRWGRKLQGGRSRLTLLAPIWLALMLSCLGLLLSARDLLHRGAGATAMFGIPDAAGANNGTQAAAPQRQLTPTLAAAAPLAPLNTSAIRMMFPRMVEVAQRHSGPYRSRAAQMMSSQVPLISTAGWKLHSPGGRLYSLAEVQRLALESRGAGNLAPNFAHYVLPFGDTKLQFHQMVCLLSCLHVMRPARLVLWYAPGRLPQGEWWQRVRDNLTLAEWESRVILAQREPPRRVYSVPVFSKEHQSDVMRLEAMVAIGGVYLDIDVLVLKPLEPLRRRECTIGREVSYGLCNGALVSAPNATFLAMWHTAYQVFNDASWVDHSVWLPNSMDKAFPGLCHVEEDSMHRPNWTPEEVAWIYKSGQRGRWNWRKKNYVMHLWFRKYNMQHNMESIGRLDSMFGEMCRFILFGTP